MKKRLVLALAVALTVGGACAISQEGPSSTGFSWTWQRPDTEIYHASFSADGTEVAFVQKYHWPDGHEAEMVSDEVLTSLRKRQQSDPRFADPRVCVVRVGEATPEFIAYGWSPRFSPDSRKIAYASQVRPLTGLRALASTLRGNSIEIYDRQSDLHSTVATPSSGYLLSPVFSSEGTKVLFSMCDATNGAYGGTVGVGIVNLRTDTVRILYEPRREYGLYHLIGPILFLGDAALAVRRVPTGPGTFLADTYQHELLLLDHGETRVYSWGTHEIDAVEAEFRLAEDGKVEVHDKEWRRIDLPSTAPREAVPWTASKVSPDGRCQVDVAQGTITVADRDGATLACASTPGEVTELQWSPDSTRLLVVASYYRDSEGTLFDRDAIHMLELKAATHPSSASMQ